MSPRLRDSLTAAQLLPTTAVFLALSGGSDCFYSYANLAA